MPLDPHELECARAAIAARIEKATTPAEAKKLREWLREIELESGHQIAVNLPFENPPSA